LAKTFFWIDENGQVTELKGIHQKAGALYLANQKGFNMQLGALVMKTSTGMRIKVHGPATLFRSQEEAIRGL
jgi:hypothetical protein